MVMKENNDIKQPSPYLAARREWEEVYGGYVQAARAWRLFGFISLIIAAVSTAGAIYLSCTKEVRAYIVQTDKQGSIQSVKSIDDQTDPKVLSRVISRQLVNWIKNTRNVTIDAQIERENVKEAYACIQIDTPAMTKLNEHFKSNDPFSLAEKETIYADITSILQLKDGAYQLQWKEKTMDRTGRLTKPVESWSAVCYTEILPPHNEQSLFLNPTGLIIRDFNWSKEL